MSKCCKGICEKYSRLSPNYHDGKKSCRECGFFLVTQEVFCPCCKYPLACKGRANRTQLDRRLAKLRTNHASKDSDQLTILVRQVVSGGVSN